jgi:hypothetical protein
MASLSERVYGVMADDTGPGDHLPPVPGITEPDSWDLQHWGVTFGIAYALVRAADPFQSAEKINAAAYEGAEGAWLKSNWDRLDHPQPELAV